MIQLSKILFVLTLLIFSVCANGQQFAFPGAEGFGAYAEGGRGGDVYVVKNLNDSGAGSLRYGIQSANGPRTIVFEISGLIKLNSALKVDKDYITIAGQTAPGDGICLRDHRLAIKANHVIVRYVRSRLGSESGTEDDAISIESGHNIIMDHCSASWSIDECFSSSTGDKDKINNVTVQWSIISEALNNSIHSKGSHSYGALIRGCYGAKYSYHHNLFAHNKSRNPRPGNYNQNNHIIDTLGLLFDYRNNVMYNWQGSGPGYDADSESVCRYNYVGNYGKPGPNSSNSGYAYKAGCKYFRGFYSDNYFFGEVPENQESLVKYSGTWSETEKSIYKMDVPFPTGPMFTHSSLEAYDIVLLQAGASLKRDVVDQRVVNDVKNGTGAIIDSQNEVGGWPVYVSETAPLDTDQDGMPDNWEDEKGLDKNNPDDRNGFLNNDEFTNLEIYLAELVGKDIGTAIKNIYAAESSVSVYPNPFTNEIKISSNELISKADLYDFSGRKQLSVSDEKGITSIPVNDLKSGCYLLKTHSIKGNTICTKVIKK